MSLGEVFKQYLIREFNASPGVAEVAKEFIDNHPTIMEIVPQDGWFAVVFDPDARWKDVVRVFEDLAAFNPCNPPLRLELVMDEWELGPYARATYDPALIHPDFDELCGGSDQ